jgi:hypothetical protein
VQDVVWPTDLFVDFRPGFWPDIKENGGQNKAAESKEKNRNSKQRVVLQHGILLE